MTEIVAIRPRALGDVVLVIPALRALRRGFPGVPCCACDRTHCPHWNCMPGVPRESAFAGVLEHLERHGLASALGPAAGA